MSNRFRLALVAFVVLFIWSGLSFIRYLYPFSHREMINQYAVDNNLSPFLLAAVVRVESRFKVRAYSSRGAIGLMQILPDTGRWAATQMGLGDIDPDLLYDPAINLRLGAWYLDWLRRDFDGNIIPALAAYNGGRRHVKEWLSSSIWDGKLETIHQIPFGETRDFVRRVIRDYRVYSVFYGGILFSQ
ncbi:MAG: lytic transglycosylase domain-containing protein [Firmicutes bacterium]|nr:lytic transglycosylase domain-containing protein [Bacillota bacterium]MCL5039162.1 lytic transglycosylase domain-containing protein [Bacillota bacterium]